MSVESFLKDEVFQPLATTIVPGALALGPYVLIAAYYVHPVAEFWEAHPNAFVTILAILVIAAGLLCEDLGSEIEVRWLDRKMKNRDAKFQERWDKYLQLVLEDSRVGKKYLKSVLLRFKFELAMIPAVITLTIGLTWLNAIYIYLAWRNFIFVALFFLVLVVFLCCEANQGVVVLDNTRKQLLEKSMKVDANHR